MMEVRIGEEGGDEPGADELAREALEQIADEARAVLCPVHGTPPKIIMAEGGLTMETCCEELDDALDRAFPEGEEEDDWDDEEDDE